MARYISLIGYPLKHSFSPDLHQVVLDHYGLDVRYEKWETQAEKLPSVINMLKQPQNLGANVTVPYKEMVLPLIDEVDDLAKLVGAVNTIVNKDEKLSGFNTDVYGFLRALSYDAKFEPAKKRALILGAGGAARAVSFGLLQEKVSYLAIANRTQSRAEVLAEFLKSYCIAEGLRVELAVIPWQDLELRKVECQLIVDCTTMGMRYSAEGSKSPLSPDVIMKDVLVYDIVYNPLETPLLKMAREAGAKILGGLPMLVYQGAASFKLWTGKEAPVDIMFAVAKKALLGKSGS